MTVIFELLKSTDKLDIKMMHMFAEMGCHTEYVTELAQIRPALERSLGSGKSALINVIPDNRGPPTFLYQSRLRSAARRR